MSNTTLVSALVLAGGKATRLGGIAKHEIMIEGETIFERQVRVLAPRVAEILVSGPEIAGYRNVRDAIEGAGPLAGIAAGLAACKTPWLLVVAGDMPHITPALIDSMIAGSGASNASCVGSGASNASWGRAVGSGASNASCVDNGADDSLRGAHVSADSSPLDAVGVRSGGLPEPLLCVLSRRVLPVIERALEAGRFKASRILTDDGLRVHWIDHAEPADLRNVNSPEDLGRITGSK